MSMTETFVTKRTGKKEALDTSKIKDVISWAGKDLDVNVLALESKVEDALYCGVSTTEIHDNIIYHAQSLATPQEPDWVYVAGRLNTMKRWKDTRAYDLEFFTYVEEMKEEGKYTHPALEKYSQSEIEELEKSIKMERDLAHSYGSTLTANKKYLMEGEVIQYAFMVEAMIIFAEKDDKLSRVVELYDALSERKISLATPWLGNLRSNGNISSCFIIAMDDDLESITDGWKKAAKISKMGGGLGVYLGYLRAKGSSIGGRPNSSKSVAACAKVLNDIAVYIDQGGKRAGAFTPALPIWHNDVEEFLDIQAESGDVRSKAYDLFPQITTPDLFWEIDKQEGWWYTFCPAESKRLGLNLNDCYGKEFEDKYHKMVELAEEGKLEVYSKKKARDVVKHIMRTQFETGLPYVTFFDKLNRDNPNKHEGIIPCFNLCTEQAAVFDPYNRSHTCNLASIVAGRMKDYDEVEKYSSLVVEVLDAGIELTSPPTECSREHNNSFRTVGAGIQGYHDWLAKEWKDYLDTKEATRFAEHVQYGAVKKSIELAKEFGAYPCFEGSDWDKGVMFDKFEQRSVTDLDWNTLRQECALYGIRNSQLTSPAPNTSTSVFMDAAAGVPPVYSPFFREDNDNGKYPISCMHLKENPLSYSRSFKTYNQAQLAKTVGAMQLFVDTGISAEYLLDQNKDGFTAKDLYDLLRSAYESGCKATYYIRSLKKGESVEDLLGIKEEGCAGCAG